ncbi:Uu.00g032210.m01.CDS01 [Anthostomella pinea]|uniref:Uu.00g032210.m01.CDS01 n=1 Tax=Anthostomella pinea TaxID=933095 RepID=A0AAI8V8N9_9PEZI|nr:Uu.00g032210.m01.CDS01 [Anthostomella pinea]
MQTAATHPAYEDKSLKSDDEIRLLTLQPAHSNDDDVASALTSRPRRQDTSPSPTPGAAALLALRNFASDGPAVPTVVWIDSICINQENLRERSAQVSRIGDTFGGAKETVIYLGEPDHHTDKTAEALRNIVSQNFFLYGVLWLSTWGPLKPSSNVRGFDEPHKPLADKDDPDAADRYSGLLDLLKATCRFQCQDPRDKLFGILSLLQTSPNHPSLLRPDYAKQARDVFIDLAFFLLRSDCEELLALAPYTHTQSNHLKLPSWVVSWSELPQEQTLAANNRAWDNDKSFGKQCLVERHGYCLSVQGLVMDTVKEMLPTSTDLSGLRAPAAGTWSFFVTETGYQDAAVTLLESAETSVRAGDCICVLIGCRTPFLLRLNDKQLNRWSLISECRISDEKGDLSYSKLEMKWFGKWFKPLVGDSTREFSDDLEATSQVFVLH